MEEILKVSGMTKIFGEGCPNCLGGDTEFSIDSNRCPSCGSIIGCYDINLSVYPGEVLGIVGESGSGKSTVLNGIYFNHGIERGDAFFKPFEDGQKSIFTADSQTKRLLRNAHFGIVYQNPYLGLNFKVSGEGNIAERLLSAGNRNFKKIQDKVHEMLERVEFPRSRYKDLPGFFSGGMQQRIQIAKALISRPSLILLDEPTGGLDLSVQARILDLIRSISREMKVAMVMVSHDMQVIRLLCERIIVMRNGRIIEEGITDRVIDDPIEDYTQTLVHSTL